MAVYGRQETRTFEADADLSSQIYHIMRISSGDTQRINVSSNAADMGGVGVLQTKPEAAGRFATVAMEGHSKVTVGAAVNSVGIHFTTNGSGRAIAASSGDVVYGRIFETANADGDVVEARLDQPFRLSGSIS